MSKKRFTLLVIILPTAALLIFSIVNSLNNYNTGISFGLGGSGCERIETYIVIRNDGALPFNMAGCSFGDSHASYVFPEYWLEPGQSVKLWSGFGVDDQENLYAGRSNPMWALDTETWQIRNNNPFSFEAYAPWQITCDLAVP